MKLNWFTKLHHLTNDPKNKIKTVAVHFYWRLWRPGISFSFARNFTRSDGNRTYSRCIDVSWRARDMFNGFRSSRDVMYINQGHETVTTYVNRLLGIITHDARVDVDYANKTYMGRKE